MLQIVPLHTTNILLPDTCILSKSNDPIIFKVIIITISIRFSIRTTFHLILDEIGYYSNCNTSQLIVMFFFNFLQHIVGLIFSVFFYILFLFVFAIFRHIFFCIVFYICLFFVCLLFLLF